MHVLGNGRLATWISDSGAGTLRWQDWNLTRWVADPTTDDTGIWMYVRDEETGVPLVGGAPAVWRRGRTRSTSCSIRTSPNSIDVTVTWPSAWRSSSLRRMISRSAT